MNRTTTTLADGRELHYYDGASRVRRPAPDQRPLEQVGARSELRFDPVLEEWVIVAGHRQGRTHRPSAGDCPLCPSGEGRLTEVPADDYDVVVFENRFPALSGREPGLATGPTPSGPVPPVVLDGSRPGVGRCEVVCFTPEHDVAFADLSRSQAELVVDAWRDRTEALSADPSVEQVFCFENHGVDIGVTLEHPHGQIYGYPFVTPRTRQAMASAEGYHQRTGRNLFDDVLARERADASRVVLESAEWTAFVPHAARWPFEIHLYPNHRVRDLAHLSDAQAKDLAGVSLDVMGRFERLFDGPSAYVAGWHQTPTRAGDDDMALHLEVFTVRRAADKLKYLAGSESGMGAFTNDVVPEEAARRLRAAA
ncbi:galactose-1-phosphate uridylyltransferase [Luteimicrobium subarcticum]|uniref:Galactose-1-phosphate uridylyltransferase n=1 Tax=Luteimicrobium subarcticum TaxID=620910 RepID=A0A2M8WSW9_9MICO|nr:galactose-1-phosphate uridylyltransferase [Luteimicrobium subarcticum]PJI93926.1 UDPglucose--hexose-1-phosphate uridylyltransferase [Luteimicrobium subarcticum]